MVRLSLVSLLCVVLACAQEGVSSAGHARAGQLAALGRLPSAADIVIEDLINFHRHDLVPPGAGDALALDLRTGGRTWSSGQAVLQIGLAAARLHEGRRIRPLNLALVLDTSGSMASEDKIEALKESVRRFVRELRPTDRVAIVQYASEATLVFEGLVEDGTKILAQVALLEASGSTNLQAGLLRGFEVVQRHFDPAATNRVILLTDGIANVGIVEPKEIVASVARFCETVDLSTIGVGSQIQQDLLRELSRAGRGVFHLISNREEMERIFVKEFQSLVSPVARQVRVELTWDAGAELLHVYGYRPALSERRLVIELEDLNHGATLVILAKFRRTSDSGGDSGPVRFRVRVAHSDVTGEQAQPRTLSREVQVQPGDGELMEDPVVGKNHGIAVMARGLQQMAVANDRKAYGEASTHLGMALDHCRANFPTTKDPDILRVRQILEGHQRTLAGHLDRFRDL